MQSYGQALNIVKRRVNAIDTPVMIFCNLQKALKAIALSLTSQKNRF